MEHELQSSEEKQIRPAVDRWREVVVRESERPEWFWKYQRVKVQSRIEEIRTRAPKLVWAAVAATFALAVALVIPAQHIGRPDSTQSQSVQPATEISDHDLMLAVERTLNAGVPYSLEPAGMLAQEMDQALQKNLQTQKSKETKYEN